MEKGCSESQSDGILIIEEGYRSTRIVLESANLIHAHASQLLLLSRTASTSGWEIKQPRQDSRGAVRGSQVSGHDDVRHNVDKPKDGEHGNVAERIDSASGQKHCDAAPQCHP